MPVIGLMNTGQREWDLFRVPLERMDTKFFGGVSQTANMVWPDDKSWCIASEIDLNTTYIGGTASLIEDLLAADDLEVWPAEPDDDIMCNADTLNSG